MPPSLIPCEKSPASGKGGVVVTNHPLGSAAGYQVLAEGGNAIDAAVAALFALCVVEPMMVGIAGGGLAHIRTADGNHTIVDGLAHAPASVSPNIYDPVSDEIGRRMETIGRRSELGASAVAVPGNLAAWCTMHARWGKLPLADIIAPALAFADRGFTVTPYLEGAINEAAEDLLLDPVIAGVLLPDGAPLKAGARLVQPSFAESLRLIARIGAAALHGGELGVALANRVARDAPDRGWLTLEDLRTYVVHERNPVAGDYRGHRVIGPPPPASSGVHIVQMLNMIEGHDIRGLGFGTVASIDLIARAMQIAFEDRYAHSGDPAFVNVPIALLMSKDYARDCQNRMRLVSSTRPKHDRESADTTHITIADRDGNIVSATHTINGLFGARFMEPETGIIPNNYMMNFDPHPGRALSVEAGKRVPTSMAPMIVLRDGAPRWALGLPGGLRIFPSAFQAIVNLIDHEMPLQKAIEAPRVWTEGAHLELEPTLSHLADELEQIGYEVRIMPHIGGGMNAIELGDDGQMQGAACWRADGTVAALGGGRARPGVRFWPGQAPGNKLPEVSGSVGQIV